MAIKTPAGTLRVSAMIMCVLLASCSGDDGSSDDPPGTKVELSYCLDKPVWVAVQDGDGPWTRVLPVAEGQYEATFKSTRGGVATVGGGGATLQVNFGTLAELATITCDYGYKFVTGTVSGVTYPQRALVHLGGSQALVLRDTFRLAAVADGPQDLFAVQVDDQAGETPGRVIIRRDQDPPSNSSLAPIDFNSAEAFVPAVSTFSLTNVDNEPNLGITGAWHGRGAMHGSLRWAVLLGPASGQYAAVPLALLGPADLSSLDVAVFNAPSSERFASAYFREPRDITVAMGPVISTPTVTIPTVGSTIRPRLQLPSQADYGRLVYVTYFQDFDQVTVAMTSAYLGGTPAMWDLEVPDLSAADGWNEAWGFASAEGISWFVSVEGGADRLLGDVVREGDVFRSADNSGGDTDPAGIRALARGRHEPHRGGFPQLPLRTAP